MDRFGKILSKIAEPDDYYSGKDWVDLILPRQVLCFVRNQYTEEKVEGANLLKAKANRYDQHRRFVLLIAKEGMGQVVIEKKLWKIGPGSAILMFPHQVHYYSDLEQEFTWLFITFNLPLAYWVGIQELRDSPRQFSESLGKELTDFVELWLAAKDSLDSLQASCQLGQILVSFLEAEPLKGMGKESELVRMIRDRVQEDLQADLSVNALAEHVGISGSRLREQFRQGVGVSLGHFVRSVRLMQATKLLRDSNLSVSEVAEQSGFTSIAVFSRAFGQVYNASPSAYRKAVTNFELNVRE